jgi:transposase
MARPYKLVLTTEQLYELEWARDNHSKPYVRERAAAILKVAHGHSIRQVALYGLLKRREPETLKEWINRYLVEGMEGLLIKPGRGRKPAFFPHHLTEAEAREELKEVVRRSPRLYGLNRSRWWLFWLKKGSKLAKGFDFGWSAQAPSSSWYPLQAREKISSFPRP